MVVVFIVLVFWWWKDKNTSWTGFYYPQEGNLQQYVKSPEFKKIDECRNWVDAMENKYNPSGSGFDYECGKNCKLSKSGIIYNCDETIE